MNTAISKFTVSKSGVYAFLPQFRTKFLDEGVLCIGMSATANPQYPICAHAGSSFLYAPKNTTLCINGINFHELTAGVTYYIVAYQTSSSTITIEDVNWYRVMLMREIK